VPFTPLTPGIAAPLGSLMPTPLMVTVDVPLAVAAMLTLQVKRTDPSGITSVLSKASTKAFTPVQALPLQPAGCPPNWVPPLLMSGFTAQSGLPFTFRFSVALVLSNVSVLAVPATCAPPECSVTLIVT
jgi:hypothetical protein